jgi:hypothetical protein
MSVRAHATCTSPTRAVHRRHSALAGVGIAGLALALTLTGCFGPGGEPTPEPSQTNTATAPPSGTPADAGSGTATATATGGTGPESSPVATEASGTLPSPYPVISDYEGEPRRLDEVYHLECIHALDGEDVPEMTDGEVAEDTKPVWSVQRRQALTEGWKNCPTQMYGTIAIPAVFTVEASPGGGSIERLRIFDADGRQVGGVGLDSTGAAPDGTELIQVMGTAGGDHLASPAYGDETPYLRTMVARTGSGHQLLIDLVSAPEGVDPHSLEVWDLAAGGEDRHLVYASIPLDSLADASEAADSELHAVLESMVGSYTVPAQ